MSDKAVEAVAQEAEKTFWATVAKAYPDITTGDLDPVTVHTFHTACESVIRDWLAANGPDVELVAGFRLHSLTDYEDSDLFDTADAAFAYAREHGLRIKGH